MSLIDSLLAALVKLDGDALVMHVGEKPYVVTSSSEMNDFRGPLAWGQVELSSKLLTTDAVVAILDQLLPPDVRRSLEEVGAIEHDLSKTLHESRFVVIAARGGQDIWLEIRHVRPSLAIAAGTAVADLAETQTAAAADRAPGAEAPVAAAAAAVPVTEAPVTAETSVASEAPVPAEAPVPIDASPAEAPVAAEPQVALEIPAAIGPAAVETPVAAEADAPRAAAEAETAVSPPPAAVPPGVPQAWTEPAIEPEVAAAPVEGVAAEAPAAQAAAADPIAMDADVPELELVPEVSQETPTQADVDALLASTAASLLEAEGQLRLQEEPSTPFEPMASAARDEVAIDLGPLSVPRADETFTAETPTAVIVPIARVVRESPPPQQVAATSELDRLLRIAAARGASALYTVARAKPVVGVDGEMQTLDAEDVLTPEVVDTFMMSVAPGQTRAAVRAGETTEWICDVAEVGRVRCLSFRDHRGPGVIFRMLPPRAISAEQLGLSKEIQALSALPDGLVLLAGPRASGTSTVVAAFVDLVNRTRSEHVVTIESQILFLHEAKRSFVSQREVRGRGDEIAAAARAALREDPDVLVIEELASADAVVAAVEAAQSGRLVFGGLRAASSEAALERLLEQAPAERRPQLRSALASSLRGVIVQALLRKRGGGRVAARELLLNTPAVAALIAEGNLLQIRAALQTGRKLGMVPLNDALAGLVRAGIVDPGEAYRNAADRDGLVAQLRREGIDTSFVERLA
jgi:twitching motility protein PilT